MDPFKSPPLINNIDFDLNSGKLNIGKNVYNISSGENIQYDELGTGFKVIGSTTTYDSINVKPKESSEINIRSRWS